MTIKERMNNILSFIKKTEKNNGCPTNKRLWIQTKNETWVMRKLFPLFTIKSQDGASVGIYVSIRHTL